VNQVRRRGREVAVKTRGLVEPGKEESMVAKKGKKTKKVKDLSLKKVTAERAKAVKGGGKKSWIDVSSAR
jgi:hypothetical protein